MMPNQPYQPELDLDLPPAPPPPPDLDTLRATNRDLFLQLARAGARPDPVAVLLTRLNTLIEQLYGAGEDIPARTRFETRFETAMTALLHDMLGQVRRATLSAPPATMPAAGTAGTGLILPGA